MEFITMELITNEGRGLTNRHVINTPAMNEKNFGTLKIWATSVVGKMRSFQFHCFTVHFNSLYIMVQLMHLFVIKH
jgi:hypothetical protein